jgi:hypothetical protein
VVVEQQPAQNFLLLVGGLAAVGAVLPCQVGQDHARLREPPRSVLQHRRFAHLVRLLAPRRVARHPLHEINKHVFVFQSESAQQECDLVAVAEIGRSNEAVHGATLLGCFIDQD